MSEQHPRVTATDDPKLAEELGFTERDEDTGQFVAPAESGAEPDRKDDARRDVIDDKAGAKRAGDKQTARGPIGGEPNSTGRSRSASQ